MSKRFLLFALPLTTLLFATLGWLGYPLLLDAIAMKAGVAVYREPNPGPRLMMTIPLVLVTPDLFIATLVLGRARPRMPTLQAFAILLASSLAAATVAAAKLLSWMAERGTTIAALNDGTADAQVGLLARDIPVHFIGLSAMLMVVLTASIMVVMTKSPGSGAS